MTPGISRCGVLKASTALTGAALTGTQSPHLRRNPVPAAAQQALLASEQLTKSASGHDE